MSEGTNFIDHVRLYIKSGKGGAGSNHLRREAHVPKGGPDGGDGGRGGHVVLKGNSNMWTLLHLRYQKHIKAEDGKLGGGQRMSGARGKDAVLEVPPGTLAKWADTEEIIGEVTENEEELVLMEGGKGGLGNDHFKSATNQTPRYAQPGIPAEEAWIVLELKVLADVGLVGYPNAGKSTLLSVVSAAKPEIADYPFTTLTPKVGVVEYRDFKSFIMADIPGIIEGAAEGKGLGIRFLRHIERNAVLLFTIPADSDDINKEYNHLLSELKQYNPELMLKTRMAVITKADMLDEELMEDMRKEIELDIPWMFISAVSQYNIMELKDKLWELLQKEHAPR